MECTAQNKFGRFKTYLSLIDHENRLKCLKLFNDNRERFEEAPGSLSKHQAWPGGYIDHMMETMDAALRFYGIYGQTRTYPFKLSDVILVLFLHDVEKPFKYVEPKKYFRNDYAKRMFINELIDKYGIVLTAEHHDALNYIHGEGKDFSRTERVQSPLAAYCHVCDVFSARIWHDYPKNKSLTEKSV